MKFTAFGPFWAVCMVFSESKSFLANPVGFRLFQVFMVKFSDFAILGICADFRRFSPTLGRSEP